MERHKIKVTARHLDNLSLGININFQSMGKLKNMRVMTVEGWTIG